MLLPLTNNLPLHAQDRVMRPGRGLVNNQPHSPTPYFRLGIELVHDNTSAREISSCSPPLAC